MEQKPFYIERDLETNADSRNSLQTQVSPEVYHDFMKYVSNTGYVKRNGDPNKAQALSDIVINFLNNNALEQKFFRNLNAILLLPRTSNPDELNETAQVIGFIDGNDWLEITLLNVFHGGKGLAYPLRHNFMYTLREFDEYNYNNFLHYFNKIYGFDDTIFFNIDEETQQDFDKVKARLSELYEDIDIDDAYFVMFTFNNYLDKLQDGVYRSKSSDLEHEGVIVLLEDLYQGVFARIKWSYIQHELSFSLQFDNIKDFERKNAFDLSNPEILKDFKKITKTVSSKGKYEFKKNVALKEIDTIDLQIETLKQKRERKLQEVKNLDEKLSQFDEDNS